MTTTARSLLAAGSLAGLDARLDEIAFMGGWAKREPSLWADPRSAYVPAVWRWEEAKAVLEAAGPLISTEQTERRNLFMVNPVPGNHYDTLRTLVSAYQGILPGERARSHRHSPNALRLVLEAGAATYTVVDGVRIDMQPGDVVLTPSWCWHGHGNEGELPGYWIDFLDVPLVHLLEPMFFEPWPAGFQEPEQITRESPFVFSLETTQRAFASGSPDAQGRCRLELGAPALPTMKLVMERVPAGRATPSQRTTANRIVAIVSGEGETTVGDRRFTWTRGDVVVIPQWHEHAHRATSDALLFEVSDQPALAKLGFLREEA